MKKVRFCFSRIFPLLLLFFHMSQVFGQTPTAGLSLVPTPVEMYTPQPTPVKPSPPLDKAGAQVIQDRPWMNDLYSWNEKFDLDLQQVVPNLTGAYCVGNGRAFGLVGLSSPLWNWSNLYGASYQEPTLGDMRMTVTRAGVDAKLNQQQIGWVKRSGVVKVKAEGAGLMVESYDFAPVTPSDDNAWDNPAVLVRLVHIVNGGDHAETDLDIALKLQPAWNIKFKERVAGRDLFIDQKASRAKKRTFWRMGAFNNKDVRIWDNNLHYSAPSLGPGQEVWVSFYLAAAGSTREVGDLVSDIRHTGPLVLLDQTRDYYQKWFESGTQFTGDMKVTDLFEVESTILKSVQARTGGFSPLIGYSYTWIRDNNGPIRWFLKTGHPQEAKKPMDFFYGVSSSMGTLPSSVRVDYTLNFHLKNLSHLQVGHAETPSWIVLQHWWYYLTTGDLEYIRGRWAYLKECIQGQVNEEDKYFFNRDETYLWCLESRVFDHVPFPNYMLNTYAFATDSSFDLVSAADHLAYMGKYLEMDKDISTLKTLAQRVRDKAEETYWNEKAGYWEPAQSLLGPLYNAPFANILVNPYWCGYARNDLDPMGETSLASKRAVEAIKNAYPLLARDDGFWKTTPSVDYFVGMNPGQLLYALCRARLPWADKVYPSVFKTATPSGDFAEMYDGDYHPWNPPAWGIGTSGRLRPWEAGLNVESILEYLTGFSPDAGDNRVVFSPHLPEDMKEFGAQRLLVGPLKVSIFLKRLDSHSWTVTLHLDRGEQMDVIIDFWASHRFFSDIETLGTVTWDKPLADSNGHEARCSFTLEADKDCVFTISEGALLPDEELKPPKPQVFHPDPYDISNADLLLVTSPNGIMNKHKHILPEDILSVGTSELKTMNRITSSVSFLDVDLPVTPEDIANGLLDEKGNPKVRLAVFGRGAFSTGKNNFKPVSYWTNSKFGQTVKKFVEQGGCLFLGPSYPDREVLPDWLVTLTGGGWEEGTLPDKVIVADSTKMQSNQKFLDEVDVGNQGSESSHAVTFTGETFEDDQNLPDSQNEKKMIHDDGRGFTGYYQFAVKSEPGAWHRLWLRVNTGHNIKGMALQIQVGDEWKQVGIRTQSDGTTRHFLALYFDVPEKYITSNQTVLRLTAKTGDEVNAYHLWMFKVEGGQYQPLAQILGFGPNQEVGQVSHGLLPKGSEWKAPLILSQHPEQGAVIIEKIGKGYLIRSELALEDSVSLLKSFLRSDTLAAMDDSWGGS